jgi:Zn-dependent protease with chaperone function
MPLLFLLVLALACYPDPQDRTLPPQWLGAHGSILLTWAGIGIIVGVADLLSWWTRRQLVRDPDRRDQVLHRYASWRLYHLIALFAVYGLALFVLGWGGAITPPQGGGWWANLPGVELVILAPLLVGLVLSWAFFYDVERTLHQTEAAPDETTRFWSRTAYVGFQIRQNLALVLVPVLGFIVLKNLPRLLPQVDDDSLGVVDVIAAGGVLAVLAVAPWIFRLVLNLRPLPAGPLHDRLQAAAQRLNFRCSAILLWNTRGGIVNAMLVGVLPMLRYVVLTDRLIAEMTPDEVEAVFGHEVGHVKHRHLLCYLLFWVMSVQVLGMLWSLAEPGLVGLIQRRDLAMLSFGVEVVAYIFLVFGFLSRRCERQADIYGCRAVSCTRQDCREHTAETALAPGGTGLCPTGIHTFVSALEKVALLNGISRDKPGWLQSWQHGSIARRVDFLLGITTDPAVEPRFQRRVRTLKGLLFLGLGAVLLLASLNADSLTDIVKSLRSLLGNKG